MTNLPPATLRRLQKLPQDQSVWEGDRRALSSGNRAAEWFDPHADEDDGEARDCILWADGSQGIVRGVDMVNPGTGSEATVRTLLRAMENPQGPASPNRPQKIVVCDRELQFFLRGIVRDLGIAVECVPNLPFLDEVFETLNQPRKLANLSLAPQWLNALQQGAQQTWETEPWSVLEDHHVLAIEINQWDVGTLYVTVLGMAGMEYGLLFYRTLDSLKRFRATANLLDDPAGLEESFLLQDCLYLNYAYDRDDDDNYAYRLLSMAPSWDEVEPNFGSIHPLEGVRPFLYDEESQIMIAGLEAVQKFVKQYRRKLRGRNFPALTATYTLKGLTEPEPLTIKISTLPDLSRELLAMDAELQAEDTLEQINPFPLNQDFVPEGAMYWMGSLGWGFCQTIQPFLKVYQPATQPFKPGGEGLSVFMVQTSRPKAKAMMTAIAAAGGIKSLLFGVGEDFYGDRYDLGIIQTQDQQLHLFNDHLADDPEHLKALKRWKDRCKASQQWCGFVIAEGVTGSARGNPEAKHIVALYEIPLIKASDVGLQTLQLMPHMELPFLPG